MFVYILYFSAPDDICKSPVTLREVLSTAESLSPVSDDTMSPSGIVMGSLN